MSVKRFFCVGCVVGVVGLVPSRPVAPASGDGPVLITADDEGPDETDPPERVVTYLLSLPHGPVRTNQRGRDLLAILRRDPQRYVAAIQAQLALPENAHLGATLNEHQMRFGGALGLAAELAREQGGPLVHMALGAIDDRMASMRRQMAQDDAVAPDAVPKPAEVLWTLDHLRRGALQAAERMQDPFAVPYVLSRLAEFNSSDDPRDSGTIFVMLRYLATVAPGDALAFERLKAMIEAPSSRLARDPQARRTLDVLRQTSRPATRPSAAPTQP